MSYDEKVTVLIASHNHQDFIKDAIEGAVQQKTNFKFEVLVFDDASTDDTPLLIQEYEKKYPGIVQGVYLKENLFQQSKCGTIFLSPKLRGEYIATCDGDDYWMDDHKLQTQVDFLDAHNDYSMCMHNAVKLNYITGEKILLDTFSEEGTYTQEQQILAGLGTNFPASSSYMLRAELFRDIPDFFLSSQVLDYPVRQYFASKGKVYYFKKPMSVYRVDTKHSYMKETRESQAFYNHYTLQMIRFFERFDQYTKQRFSSVLKKKIISDYFGFCSSIDEPEGLDKAALHGLDIKIIKNCYKCLSTQHLDQRIYELQEESEGLFIYGVNRLASICKKQFDFAKMEFEGFVVSDGQMKEDFIENKKVYYLSEVLAKFQKPGFILAVQPVNAEQIVTILKQFHVTNYCRPYTIAD